MLANSKNAILRKPFKFSFIGAASSGIDGTSFTFANQSIGPARSDRIVIVGVVGRSAGLPVATVTIQGVAATQINQLLSSNDISGLFAARIPAGAIADIVVDCGAVSLLRCGIAVYAKLGGRLEAFASATSSAANPTTTLTVPAYGVAVGVAMSATATTFTTAGLTEDFDSQIGAESSAFVAGSTLPGALVGSNTFTFTPASSIGPTGTFAVWSNN